MLFGLHIVVCATGGIYLCLLTYVYLLVCLHIVFRAASQNYNHYQLRCSLLFRVN